MPLDQFPWPGQSLHDLRVGEPIGWFDVDRAYRPRRHDQQEIWNMATNAISDPGRQMTWLSVDSTYRRIHVRQE